MEIRHLYNEPKSLMLFWFVFNDEKQEILIKIKTISETRFPVVWSWNTYFILYLWHDEIKACISETENFAEILLEFSSKIH